MEKSIESIWKEGFLSNNALVAPKLNDLYNQKSVHTIDKFKSMGKTNLYAIAIGGTLVWIVSFIIGAGIAGSIIYAMLMNLVFIGKRQAAKLEKIDNGSSSYEYLKGFDQWLEKSISIYGKVYRFFYPIFFLCIILGFFYSNLEPFNNGELLDQMASEPGALLILGIPLYFVLGLSLVVLLSFLFSPLLYKFDIEIVYGRIFQKIEEMLKEMEELRN